MRATIYLLPLALTTTALSAQTGYVAPNAPRDQPRGTMSSQTSRLDSAIAPYIAQARASWPGAKARYLAGLPPRNGFFVTTRLHDPAGHREQVFVAVDSMARDSIYGTIQSQIMLVRGFRLGQPYALPESDLIDWLISKPDGTEEGNFVGNFLDHYHP